MQTELRALASRLAVVYRGSKRIEELRFAGLAAAAQKMCETEPERYARIASGLMDGEAVTKIAKANKTNSALVRFIRQMHPELVHASRTGLVVALEEASIAMAQRLVEEGAEMRIDRVPQALGVTLEKLAILTGGVTQRTEHVSAPRPEDVQKLFESLPKAKE